MQTFDRNNSHKRNDTYAAFLKKVLIAAGIPLALIVILLIVWFARNVVLIVFAGILVGIFLQWAKRGIMHYTGLPAIVSLVIVIVVVGLLMGALLAFLVPVVVAQAIELLQEIPQSIRDLRNFLYRFGWEDLLGEQTDSAGEMLMGENRDEMMKALTEIVGVFSTTFGAILGLVMIAVFGIYIAADKGLYVRGILLLLPWRLRPRATEILAALGHVIRWWLLGQSLSMLILGSTVTVGLWLIGIPNAIVLGVFTAMMTFVPNLGPFLAFIPIALVAISQGHFQLIYVGIFYLIIQSLEGFFITPMIHRKVITMPPVLILATQVLLFELAGIMGVLMAMPLIACTMVSVKMIYVEDILGEEEQQGREIP